MTPLIKNASNVVKVVKDFLLNFPNASQIASANLSTIKRRRNALALATDLFMMDTTVFLATYPSIGTSFLIPANTAQLSNTFLPIYRSAWTVRKAIIYLEKHTNVKNKLLSASSHLS